MNGAERPAGLTPRHGMRANFNVRNGPTMTVCMYVTNRVPLPNTSEPMR